MNNSIKKILYQTTNLHGTELLMFFDLVLIRYHNNKTVIDELVALYNASYEFFKNQNNEDKKIVVSFITLFITLYEKLYRCNDCNTLI